MNAPRTRYAAVGDGAVAFQEAGSGPVDLLFSYGLGVNVELAWEHPVFREFLSRLSSFSRLILFDRRGTGASDDVSFSAPPTWEESIEDMVAVLAAAGSTRPAVMASLDTGVNAILLAAMRPDLVRALVLVTTSARYVAAPDYPIGVPEESIESLVEFVASSWGTEELMRLVNPDSAGDEELMRFGARMMRTSATPRAAAAQYRYLWQRDVRHALPLIQVPTLVLHVQHNPLVPIAQGRYVADHVGGAQFVELPGGDVSWTRKNYVITDLVAEFLTGQRPAGEIDRILTTILFTDIVESTQHAAALGDEQWRTILDSHDRVVREQLGLFRGREVNTTGDGFVVSFDGPARAIRCAQAIIDAVAGLGIQVRVGLHTGECELRGNDLGGLAVHIAARVAATAGPGEVVVSGTVRDLVMGSGVEFTDRGTHALRGVPGTWPLFTARREASVG